MIQNKASKKWTLIGTVSGQGYDCEGDRVDQFEESNNGLWNNITIQTTWLEKTMKKLDEPICRDT